jgi:hypothetical protein
VPQALAWGTDMVLVRESLHLTLVRESFLAPLFGSAIPPLRSEPRTSVRADGECWDAFHARQGARSVAMDFQSLVSGLFLFFEPRAYWMLIASMIAVPSTVDESVTQMV